jgi:hypothetical protein
VVWLDLLDLGWGMERHTVAAQFRADERAEVGVEGGQGLGSHLDDGDLDAAVRQGVGQLGTDVAGSDDDDAPGAGINGDVELAGLVDGVQGVDAGQVDAW